MSESGDKHFEATQSRLDRAKREGNSARSQEVSSVAAFAGALAGTLAVVAPLGMAARAAIAAAAAGAAETASLLAIVVLMLVPIAAAAFAGAGAGIMQTGGLRFVAIALKPDRLNPAEGCKRMFSCEAVSTALRATIAFVCAGIVLVPAFVAIYGGTLRSGGSEAIAAAAWSAVVRIALACCAVGAAFAMLDFGIAHANWRKKLRMSFEELKRDQKEHDGDPLARGRRRSLHRQIARGSLQRVKDAAFVVTNPTHIAIALEYRPPEVPVPRVLVRAADEAATRVRELAAEHRIPLVENVPLARALYAAVRAGDPIPQDTYLAVAEIVAALTRTGVLRR